MNSTPPPIPNHSRPNGEPRSPWNIWATTGFTFAIMAIYLAVQTLLFLVFMFILSAKGDVDVEELAESGLFFGIASSVSAVISTLLVIGCVALKKGVRIVDYLKF